MTGRKNRALQVPPVAPYKALENFFKALYGTRRGTCSARFFRPVMHINYIYTDYWKERRGARLGKLISCPLMFKYQQELEIFNKKVKEKNEEVA